MKIFPVGSSNLFKTGVLWAIIVGISIVAALILGVALGEETVEQCSQNFTGEVTVTNCDDYESYSNVLMSPIFVLMFPALFYSVLGFLEFKRKRTLTVVMGAHGAKNYMKLERLLKLVNKDPSEANLLVLQNDLYACCNPLMSYVTTDDGGSIRLERDDVLNPDSLNHIFNTVAASVEPAAAVHDEAVRLQKMQNKAAQKQAAAERAHQQNMMNSMASNQQQSGKGGSKGGSMAGSVAKGVGTFMMGGKRYTYYCKSCGSMRSAKSLQGNKICCGVNMKRQK
ncbi:MAG: hypothetical protein ACPH87_07915 [Candidatus Poseidoniaceae archaeon]